MKEQSILWRRIDTVGHEAARVYGDDDGWYLDGSAIFLHESSPCRLEYLIECDTEWRTTAATIDGWVGDEVIAREILVSEDGTWFLDDEEIDAVKGCVDIDLNFSPITNLLPLRRLDMQIGESKSVSAAWVRFPSFELERLDQTYTRPDEATIKYESRAGEFVRTLKVNRDGLVLDYPDYWMAEAAEA
ncbi:MAG TPA: putative glycolipid-binding domain-containing protein [Pyrinomonadaceae bacterium]|nr:putative glycolipid-binding domain-containing protein [Pyrinomonadaceae bacterium]